MPPIYHDAVDMIVFPPDPLTQSLDVYVVGGAVRDYLLHGEASDLDWVVVGSTPEAMQALGFTPVGADFPVFLHPKTHQEYALARTERKSGRGYQGFTFYTGTDVSLEADLARRDLTVNAIAQAKDGRLIDPFNGVSDIQARIFRHIGSAFVEDPVRILRLARFMARFEDFRIASDTLALCMDMVDNGEVDALVPERVWSELSRGLLSAQPRRMLSTLNDMGALIKVAPGLVLDAFVLEQLDRVQGLTLAQRYAMLCIKTPEHHALSKHLKVNSECMEYARLLPMVLTYYANDSSPSPDSQLVLLEQLDALRRPERFLDIIGVAHRVLPNMGDLSLDAWVSRLSAATSVDAAKIAHQHSGNGLKIKEAVRAARLDKLQDLN